MANIDNVQLPDGSSYNIVDNTSGFATQNYVNSAVDSITKTAIGLGNVDNTSDLDKPISTDTQTALDEKASNTPTFTEAPTRTNIVSGESMSTLFGKIRKWFTDLPSMFVAKSGGTMSGNLTIDKHSGTTSAVSTSDLILGNNISQGTTGNSLGRIDIYGSGQYRERLYCDTLTADRNVALPNKSGTVALTSDFGWGNAVVVNLNSGTATYQKHTLLGLKRVTINSSSQPSANITLTGKIPSDYIPVISTLGTFYDNNGSLRSVLFYDSGNSGKMMINAGSTTGLVGEYLYW